MSRQLYRDFDKDKNVNPTPYVLRTLLLYLKGCFGLNPDFGYGICDEKDALEGNQNGRLLITDQNSWDTVFRGHVPSVTIRRSSVSFGGGVQGYGQSRELDSRFQDPKKILELVTMPVVISCKAREEIEAETLAFLVHHFLTSDTTWGKVSGILPVPGATVLPPVPYKPQEQLWLCDASFVFVTNRSIRSRMMGESMLMELFTNVEIESKP